MKLTYIIAAVAVMAVTAQAAGDCWKIRNHDQRKMCEARKTGDGCWKIRNKNLKVLCEVQVYGKKNCWKIQDRNAHAVCKSWER